MENIKRTCFILILLFISIVLIAQKKVAVLEPICRDNSVNSFYKQTIRGSLENVVMSTDEYVSFDRTAFDKIMEEQSFQRSGAVIDNDIRKLGVMIGVDYILVSDVSASDGYISVVVKILNIETGQYDKTTNEVMEMTPPIVKTTCTKMAQKMFGIINLGSMQRNGELQLPDGKYVGEILNGKPHGKGIIYYNSNNEDDRISYDGEWENGVISGQGTMVWKGGIKYIGGWFDGLKSGLGTFYAPGDNGATRIEGKFVKGKPVSVTAYAPNGERYEGPMPSGTNVVQGTVYYPDGRKYLGGVDERFYKQGKGTLYFSEGKLVGYWTDDVLQGFVQIYVNDGSEEYGKFINGQPDGEWTLRTASGKYYKGRYSNGVRVVQYH